MSEKLEVERDERGRFKKVKKADDLRKPVQILGGMFPKSVTVITNRRKVEIDR